MALDRRWMIERADRRRARRGIRPLQDDPDYPPELELHERLGLGWALIGAFAAIEYQRVALERAVDHVITAEDVVVHKLIAWRDRDRDDIRSILANPDVTLDEDYIEHWAEQ